jgi:hypothetical protein
MNALGMLLLWLMPVEGHQAFVLAGGHQRHFIDQQIFMSVASAELTRMDVFPS